MKRGVKRLEIAEHGSDSGAIYIPQFKLQQKMKAFEDKDSIEYQKLTWDALKKSINGIVNKVNSSNIENIIPELYSENLIRGRGLFCRSLIKSQMGSPEFSDVFSALIAVVNSKFPDVGELFVKRIVWQLKKAYKGNDKARLLAAAKFIAHLVNQQVVHELIALELLTVLLENPSDYSVETAVLIVKECGSILNEVCPRGLQAVFDRFRGILHEGEIDTRIQYLIESLFALCKVNFDGYPSIRPELDLVEQEDQVTHEISLSEEIDYRVDLDVFQPDPDFLKNENKYEGLKKSILDEESENETDSEMGSEHDDEEDSEKSEEIIDETEINLKILRRTIYLTIKSTLDFEEAGHKLLQIRLKPGQEMEICTLLLECCSHEKTYIRYYGLLAQRFCMINRVYQQSFEKCFVQQYTMVHRLLTEHILIAAKFFAHLIAADALPWHVFSYLRLTEDDTTSSSRIFIKYLFLGLAEELGLCKLKERLTDPTKQDSFESIFPRDNAKNASFSINFFTLIGLGGITEDLRQYLKSCNKRRKMSEE